MEHRQINLSLKNTFNLKNKVAIVTGGAGHIGFSISEALAEAGAEVFITSRNQNKSQIAAKELEKSTGEKVKGVIMDIESYDSIKNCFNQIESESGQIDILVNNASALPVGKLQDISDSDWKLGMDGTINGVFRCTKLVTPIMEKGGSGSIVNISSMYGSVSPDPSIYQNTEYDSPPHYGAGKAAIQQFTRFAACHLAQKGIRVNSVSPGAFPKPEIQKNEEFINNLKKNIPLNRIGQPNELKGVIIFLASQASSYVTGENIHVDGGWTAW